MSDTYVVTVGPKGRIVIPGPLRKAVGVTAGDEIVALAADDGILLLPRKAVKARLRRIFANVEGSMAEELLRERRSAALVETLR